MLGVPCPNFLLTSGQEMIPVHKLAIRYREAGFSLIRLDVKMGWRMLIGEDFDFNVFELLDLKPHEPASSSGSVLMSLRDLKDGKQSSS